MMEKIPSKMVLQNNLDGGDTKFTTISVPLLNNSLGVLPVVIIIVTYQVSAGDIQK